MLPSSTQETLLNDDSPQRHSTFLRSISVLDSNDFNNFIQERYGACWGTLKFEDSLSDYSNDARPFLYVDDNIDLHVLRQFMISEWKLQTANIVIPVLSGVTNHKPFKNQKMIETLRSGIQNAANASEVWFITNGIDAGIPQLIGSAFREETALRRADDAWAIQMGRAPKKRKALVLLGIVCDDEIKDFIDLKASKDKSKMEVKVPTRKRDQLSLNSGHSHFIIIREQSIGTSSTINAGTKSITIDSGEKQLEKLIDSAESATNRFRDRFEDFLHQEALQPPTNEQPSIDVLSTTPLISRKSTPWSDDGFPMVCTLLRGTPGTIELLYRKLQQEVPAVILKGTGSAADIIAFAYEEINAKNDKEYEDSFLKVELTRRLLDEYPTLKDNNVKRNEIRDHIISIVKKADQGKRKFLTFVDVNSTTASLNDFHKFILSALLQSQKTATGNKVNVQLKRNLLLTLDWNLPDLALSEIFQRDDDMKYSIQADLFDKALLGKKLEPFVDLFLDREFALHRYLKSDKLISLFNEAKDREFLTTTSLEGILGLTGDEEEMPKDFVEHGLNVIVKRLTGISHFFSKHEMDCNAMGIYFGDKTDKGVQRQRIRAEKKALRHLIIYAVLMNRHLLAKILWKRSSEPIPLALICCMMFKKLAPYCHESYQRLLIEKQAKEFSDCAVGVLDKAFNEDNMRTFEMLDEKHPDWNHMATVELAYNAENKEFMAHAACQKWVTRQFYGEITPRELSWGLFKCPDYLKIIFSAILIFPMWFWINFSPIGQAPPTPKKSSDLQDDKNFEMKPEKKVDQGKQLGEFIGAVNIREGNSIFQRISRCCRRNTFQKQRSVTSTTKSDDRSMSHWEEIKVLWTAPITKFYTNFVAYIAFLSFFTLAVMWPSCGNLLLDCFVWFWTASIAFENTRVAYEKYCSQSSLPLQRAVLEVIVQTIFLALYLTFRIIGLWNFGTCQVLTAKAILGVGLIYYYYRILFIYLPISPKLGPMMIRLRCMIMDDFLTFLQLFVIFMISSGVAITAVVYPHYPLGLDLFTKAFVFRGLMALFSNEMSDLKSSTQACSINATGETESEYACLRLSHGLSFKYDNLYAYNRYGISSPKCNQTSWIAWFLLIQYFFLAKRFLTSLLTAMFGLTGARVQSQSEQIWMYNRYEIVMEYDKRPRLPPPFVVISYISMLITNGSRRCIIKLKECSDKRVNASRRNRRHLTEANNSTINNDQNALNADDNQGTDQSKETNEDDSFFGYLLNCKPCRQVTDNHRQKLEDSKRNWEDSEANLYWKYKAIEYYAKTQEADKVQEKLDNLSNSVTNVQKDMDVQRKSLRQINDRVVTLEKLMTDSHILLEKIRATIQQEDKSLPECQKFIHILSRESPYVYTNEARFPVTEKYIPWKIPFDLYDPTLITLPKEHNCFRDDERPFVEPNLLKISSTDDQSSFHVDTYVTPATPLTQPGTFGAIEPAVTNITTDFTMPSFEYKWNQIVELQLPDRKKMIVDRTTWLTNPVDKSPLVYRLDTQLLIPLCPMGRTGVRGRGALIRWGPNKSIMGIITRWKRHRGQFAIVDGQRILEALVFKDKLTNDWKLPGGKILGVESPYGAVCRSFNKLAFQDNDSEHSLTLQERDMIEHFESFARSSEGTDRPNGFESHMVYRGYIDDVRNTDNAWVEAEIWNFHYGSTMSFPNLRTDGMALWKDVTYNARGFLMQTSILREIARIHDAYFE
ncbi:unnamed protein product [Rotaria sp. Silwood1]|nr:unnamed protein product [Rotaria sp. Silwood1]CAF0910298.1 unnamed protein product [Rotaria sp. Silwood1]CAF3376006.1 unnamed protein product [Rotaria sp. Silwood1]CAF4641838.1 unnamed protein product [Rotaria sp. Silwood1]